MATPGITTDLSSGERVSSLYKLAYRAFAYFGLFSIFGAVLYGFRYNAAAPRENLLFNVGLYLAFVVPHLVMSRAWFKKAVWGHPYSTPRERRVYILITVATWLAALWLQRPVPGGMLELSGPIHFAGTVGFVACAVLFFQGITFEMIDGLLGVPGSVNAHSHGAETPLFTEGPYAQVRHPMYRAVILAGICGLVVHPHVGQLLWTIMIGLTFIGFIPIEEKQMIAARGDDYRRYMERTPYRLFRGVW